MFEIMFTIYVLYSPSHNKIYIGFTSNIEQRMLSHNQLATKGYTVKFRPWILIHTEVFETKSEAMKREKELKSANGRQFIWNLIKNKAK
jgi:putative endonuclease